MSSIIKETKKNNPIIVGVWIFVSSHIALLLLLAILAISEGVGTEQITNYRATEWFFAALLLISQIIIVRRMSDWWKFRLISLDLILKGVASVFVTITLSFILIEVYTILGFGGFPPGANMIVRLVVRVCSILLGPIIG